MNNLTASYVGPGPVLQRRGLVAAEGGGGSDYLDADFPAHFLDINVPTTVSLTDGVRGPLGCPFIK